MARGVKGLAETPEMLGRAAIRGGQELAQLAGAKIENEMPVLDTATGRGIEAALSTFGGDKAMAYRGESTPAQFAGTIGEFVGPGGILGGGKKLMQASVAAGAGSEAAGQATEGTERSLMQELPWRFAGLLTSYAGKRIKRYQLLRKNNVTSRQTLITLKAEKNSAYDLLNSERKWKLNMGLTQYINNWYKTHPMTVCRVNTGRRLPTIDSKRVLSKSVWNHMLMKVEKAVRNEFAQ